MKEREITANEWGKLFLLNMLKNDQKEVLLSWADFENAIKIHKARLVVDFRPEGVHFTASSHQFSHS